MPGAATIDLVSPEDAIRVRRQLRRRHRCRRRRQRRRLRGLRGRRCRWRTTAYTHLFLGGANRGTPTGTARHPRQRVDLTLVRRAANYFGWSVSPAGDVDGDGYADFVVGSANDSWGRLRRSARLPRRAGARGRLERSRLRARVLISSSPDGANSYFSVLDRRRRRHQRRRLRRLLDRRAGCGRLRRCSPLELRLGDAGRGQLERDCAGARIDLTNPDGTSAQFGRSLD